MGSGKRYITEETLDQYLRYVTRWKQAGRPDPAAWLPSSRTSRHTGPARPCSGTTGRQAATS